MNPDILHRPVKRWPKVLFAGTYGLRSLGDDAALLFMARGLQARFGTFDGVVIARHAEERCDYGAYGLRSVQNIEYASGAQAAQKWFRGLNFGDDQYVLDGLHREMEDADLLIIGAGNALIDVTIDLLRGPIPYYGVLALLARLHRVPVMLYGITVGPFTTPWGRMLSRLILDSADVTTLRDEESLAEADALGSCSSRFEVLPDPVLGLRLETGLAQEAVGDPPTSAGRRPVVAVSVRRPSSEAGAIERYCRVIADACDGLVRHLDADIVFVPQCTYDQGANSDDDRWTAAQVVALMSNVDRTREVVEALTVDATIGLYAQADVVLGTRLHANVFAAIAGTPSIAVCYLPKVHSFMRWLGRGEYTVQLDEMNVDAILRMAKDIMANRDDHSRAIRLRVEEGRSEVARYVELAVAMLEARSPDRTRPRASSPRTNQ